MVLNEISPLHPSFLEVLPIQYEDVISSSAGSPVVFWDVCVPEDKLAIHKASRDSCMHRWKPVVKPQGSTAGFP